jgi:hypothetical protein
MLNTTWHLCFSQWWQWRLLSSGMRHHSLREVYWVYMHLLPPSTSLMMEAASASETLLHFYQNALHHTPEDSNLHVKGCYCALNSVTGTTPVQCYIFLWSRQDTLESKRGLYNGLTERTILINTMGSAVKTADKIWRNTPSYISLNIKMQTRFSPITKAITIWHLWNLICNNVMNLPCLPKR